MAFTTINTLLQNRAKFGIGMPALSTTIPTSTTAAANSGLHLCNVGFNGIGSTLPATRVSFPIPAGLPNELFINSIQTTQDAASINRLVSLAYFYTMGTVDLANAAATPYDGFTHDAGWSGTLQRTQYGSTADIIMTPVMFITTATTVTAPIFRLRTVAGGAGYVDQDGNAQVGTISFTCPATATAVSSAYILMMEDGDSGIKDMTQIEVTTKGSAGVATIFGVEILSSTLILGGFGGAADNVFGGLSMMNLNPAVATTGTVPAALGLFVTGNSAASMNGMPLSFETVLNG